jgi:hypothetical protein
MARSKLSIQMMLASNNNPVVGAGADVILGLQQNTSGRDRT